MKPELGQMMFGQPFQEETASNLLIAALQMIREEVARVEWNKRQEQYDPFERSQMYANPVFAVEGYSWDEDYEQPWNFKYKDIEVSWYKHLGRSTSVNRIITPDEINTMLNDCIAHMNAEENAFKSYPQG